MESMRQVFLEGRSILHQENLCSRCYLGSGVVLSQRIIKGSADLDGALIMFKRYLENKNNIYIKPESGIEFFSVDELFDEVMQGYINKLYPRQIVVLLQRLGWPVIFSPTRIGQTRVNSPVDILAYIMENSPSDRYSDWELDMRPLLNIETFRPHILDLMSSGSEWKEEWEDE